MRMLKIKKITAGFLAVLICGVATGIYAAETEQTIVPEDKISKELYQEFERLESAGADLTKEKIPVWIWYEDIDQKKVDQEVTEQTGLKPENLAVVFEMPSLTLINGSKNSVL